MVEHWIEASVAREIVAKAVGDYREAAIGICTRAHHGLLKTRASLFIDGSGSHENVIVPERFWWAEGHEALSAEWTTGDFSTWIDRSEHCRAFGLKFDAAGIFAMIPAAERSGAARSISIAGNPLWMTAKEAHESVWHQAGFDAVSAGDVIIDRCRLGLVTSRALMVETATGLNAQTWTERAREWEVPESFWSTLFGTGTSWRNWDRGLFYSEGKAGMRAEWTRITGAHFVRADIEAIGAVSRADLSEEAAKKAKAGPGRPSSAHWEQMICAIWGQIYRGDLVPKRQGDVEKAMLTYATEHDFPSSESTVRTRARLLFLEYEKEAEK